MKSTLLKLFAVETIISFLLRLFHGITSEQFKEAQEHVRHAEFIFSNSGRGADKKSWVSEQLKEIWPDLANFAVDLLIQVTLSYLTKKGLIK